MVRRLLSLLLTACAAAHAQQPSALHYDTVSIHEAQPSPDGSFEPSDIDDPRLPRQDVENWNFGYLITFAFRLSSYQVEGIPADLRRRRYNLHAQGGSELSEALNALPDDRVLRAQQDMLQEVLAQRFHLLYHFIDRTMGGFVLSAGRQPKLKPSAATPLVAGDSRAYDPKDAGQPSETMSCDHRGCTFVARGQPLAELTEILDEHLRGHVVDHTSLAGRYDFTLRWSDARLAASDAPVADDLYPPLEAALADQLGLKLEHSRTAQRIMIVDHLEAPSSN